MRRIKIQSSARAVLQLPNKSHRFVHVQIASVQNRSALPAIISMEDVTGMIYWAANQAYSNYGNVLMVESDVIA